MLIWRRSNTETQQSIAINLNLKGLGQHKEINQSNQARHIDHSVAKASFLDDTRTGRQTIQLWAWLSIVKVSQPAAVGSFFSQHLQKH
jgi:hypothetical protein